MVYRIAGGIFFLLTAVNSFGAGIPAWAVGIVAAVAGVALLANR